jgi:preprotein translocase subunit SecD
MRRRTIIVFLTMLAVFILCLLVILPADKGVLGNKGFLLGLDLQGGLHLVYEADLSSVEPGSEDEVMSGVVTVISNRINPLGVTEPVIERQGENRIVVELPGLDISDTQKERIGRTAVLEFRELAKDEEGNIILDDEGNAVWIPATGTVDGVEKALTSSFFTTNTHVDRNNQTGQIFLVFEWTAEGAILSEEITSRLIGQPLGIFEGDLPLLGDDGEPIAPIVNSVITDKGEITGLSLNEAQELSSQLNAGRLPVPLEAIFEQTVSPVLGADFVDLSVKAGLIGIALVMLFMIAFYRLPGLVASLALVFYGALVLAIFKLIPVTLTLAGIGGFVLSIGMAVDANILIFERMKEELAAGRTPGAAIEAGFNRAWTAIRDSNMTTFIVTAILFWVGSSIIAGAAVKGFALTLFIGVAVSMFTAIVVTRTLLRLFVGTRLARRPELFNRRAGERDA